MTYLKFITALFLLWSFSAHSQLDNAKTGIYLELLGNGGAFSINVERAINSNLYGRIGVGMWSTESDWSEESFVTFPVMVNKFIGADNNYLEVGAGVLLGWSRYESRSAFNEESDSSNGIVDLTGVVGYRYQNPEGGFIVRIGLTPFLALTGGEDAYPEAGFSLSGGLSIGYSF